jgi:hypothetical protein
LIECHYGALSDDGEMFDKRLSQWSRMITAGEQ